MFKDLSQKQRLGLVIILLATVCTLFIHHYLAERHYKVSLGLSIEDSICNVNSDFNCDNVNTSVYSELFGIPMAVWGLSFNFYFLLLVLAAAFSKKGQRFFPAVFYLSLLSALTSVVMGFISATQLGQYCLFCLTAYALSFISFAAVCLSFGPRKATQVLPDIKAIFSEARFVLLILLLIPVTAQAYHKGQLADYQEQAKKIRELAQTQQNQAEEDMIKLLIEDWQKALYFDFDTASALHYGVSEDKAIMTIVEFADMRCPHCSHAGETIKAFVDGKTDVSWSFMLFPLDGECNPNINQKSGLSCKLAKTVLCLRDHPQGWAIHEWLFARQRQATSPEETEKLVSNMVTEFKVNRDSLNLCLVDPKTQDVVMEQVNQAVKNQVQGTPALFVNGKKLMRGQFVPVLEAVYQKIKESPQP